MSVLLHLLNRLKAQASWNMLTPSQRAAFSEFEKYWQFPERINLCGPPGSGKTFLGWVIGRQYGTSSYASPGALERDQSQFLAQVIIDNAPSEDKKLRRLLAELQLRQVRNLLLITQSPIHLGLPVIALPNPTEADIATAFENCNRLQLFTSQFPNNDSFPQSPDRLKAGDSLWKVIHSVL